MSTDNKSSAKTMQAISFTVKI